MRMPVKKTDLAYIAGIVDGEGCIYISRGHGQSFYIRVQVTNTNQWLLYWLKSKLGGGVTSCANRKDNRKPIFRWRLSAEQANHFLSSILPFLKLKRKQAEIAIALQSMRQGRRHHLTEKEQAIAEAQSIIMAGLNAKGIQTLA